MNAAQMGDAEPAWVPSRPEDRAKQAPWNVVGLPEPNNAVRRAVREIETRLQEKLRTEEELRKREEELSYTTQVAQTRMLWQARERGDEQNNSSVEYRTDYYPGKEDRGENVIILKLEEVPTVETKDANVQTVNTDVIDKVEVQSYFNYEKNWRSFRNFSGQSQLGRVTCMKSSKVPSVDSQIPRVRTDRICKKCKNIVDSQECCSKSVEQDFGQRFASMDPQRSRTNFFGNTGSYALRCNLFAIPQKPPRRFYMTPDPIKLEKSSKGRDLFETFQAKKKVFYRQRLGRALDTVNYTHMW